MWDQLYNLLLLVIDTTKHRLFASGAIATPSASLTRPADTTQYAVGDVVADSTTVPGLMIFENASRIAGCGGRVTGAKCSKNTATVTNAQFRLYLYNAPITAIADNAQHALLWANRAKRIGYIDFLLATSGTGSDCAEDIQQGLNLEFIPQADTKTIYGILVALAAYTPGSADQLAVELRIEQY